MTELLSVSEIQEKQTLLVYELYRLSFDKHRLLHPDDGAPFSYTLAKDVRSAVDRAFKDMFVNDTDDNK